MSFARPSELTERLCLRLPRTPFGSDSLRAKDRRHLNPPLNGPFSPSLTTGSYVAPVRHQDLSVSPVLWRGITRGVGDLGGVGERACSQQTSQMLGGPSQEGFSLP